DGQGCVLVREGRVVHETGRYGVRRDTHPGETDARAAFERRAIALVGDGWQLVEPDGDLGTPVAADPVQEHAILDAIDDRPERLAVYTDWLLERGDPCGELASLRARHERDRDRNLGALIQRAELAHDRALFGLAHVAPSPRGVVRPVWRDGWIDAFDIA